MLTLHGHTTSIKALNSRRFSCSSGRRFGKYFFPSFFTGFNPGLTYTVHRCGQDHTGGDAVLQVKHRRNINLKLSVHFLLRRAAFWQIFRRFLILIRSHDAWTTYDRTTKMKGEKERERQNCIPVIAQTWWKPSGSTNSFLGH